MAEKDIQGLLFLTQQRKSFHEILNRIRDNKHRQPDNEADIDWYLTGELFVVLEHTAFAFNNGYLSDELVAGFADEFKCLIEITCGLEPSLALVMGGIYKDPKFWSEVRTFFGEAAFFGELQPMKAE